MFGRCQCSRIQFETPTPTPSALFICHCTQCRHQSSSAFGVTARFPYFEVTEPSPGDISAYSRPNSNGKTVGLFCTNCGSRIMHVKYSSSGERAAMVSVKAGCLEGLTKEMMRSAVHIWTREAVVDIPDGVFAYEEGPPV